MKVDTHDLFRLYEKSKKEVIRKDDDYNRGYFNAVAEILDRMDLAEECLDYLDQPEDEKENFTPMYVSVEKI